MAITQTTLDAMSRNLMQGLVYKDPGLADLVSFIPDQLSFVANNMQWGDPDLAEQQIKFLREKNYNIDNLDKRQLQVHNLARQIIDQGTTSKWTGQGFGSPSQNARAIADTLAGAGITDIRQFGQLPDGSYGNKATGQRITTDYSRAGGNIFSGTFAGEDSTGFGVQFGPDGTPYFYTQQGASTSSMGDIAPVLSLGLALFAPGIGTAIGSALGLTGTAAAVVGSAIVQGTLAEAQGGDFLDGAIKGAVTAGVAPAVANTVGTAVADVMADSAVKNVVANAVASSASSAVTAALTGGDVDQAALTGALAGGAGSVGRDIGTAVGLETDPFSQQTQMLAAQEQGLGTAGGAGANIGQALGAIGAGADPIQALLSGASGFMQEVNRATPTAGESGFVGPVASAPVQVGDVFVPGAENVAQLITSGGEQLAGPGGLTARAVEAMPEMQPRANEIAGPVEEKVEDGYVFFQREIQVTLPDGKTASYLISYDPNDTKTPIRYETATGGGESGFLIRSSATRPTFDTTTEATTGGNVATIGAPSTFVPEQVNILDLISAGRGDVSQGQPITVAPTAPVEAIPGVSEPVSGGQIDVSGAPVGTVPDIGAEITPPSTQEIPIPDQISQELGGGGVGVGGEAETVPGAVDVNVPGAGGTDFGLGGGAEAPGTGEVAVSGEVTPGAGEEVAGPGVAEDVAIDAGGEVVTEDVFPQEPTVTESPVDEPVAETFPEEVVAEEAVAQPTPVVTPYIRDFFISGGRRRGDTFGPTVTTLGQALAPPLFPSSPVSGLTSYRGAGEIEGQQTGKPRRNVWNEASLRLKDALGL